MAGRAVAEPRGRVDRGRIEPDVETSAKEATRVSSGSGGALSTDECEDDGFREVVIVLKKKLATESSVSECCGQIKLKPRIKPPYLINRSSQNLT